MPSDISFNLINAKELYECDIEPLDYLIPKYLCKSSLIYLSGSPATFKTGISLYMAICGATRKPFLDVFIKTTFKTLFIDEENGIRRTKTKFNRLVNGLDVDIDNIKDNIVFANISGFKLLKPWITILERYIIEHKPDLIIIDNIARCFVGSERDEKDVSGIHTLLKPLIEKYDVSIIILHHLTKGDFKQAKTLNDIRGSGDFGGQCDEAFLLDYFRTVDEISKIFRLKQLKIKDGQEIKDINFKVTGDFNTEPPEPLTVEFDGFVEDKKEEYTDAICDKIMGLFEALKTSKIKTQKIRDEMLKEYGIKKWKVDDACRKLRNEKILSNKVYSFHTKIQ